MAKNELGDWDTTAANNTDIGGINIDEGWPPENVNNAMREKMSQLRTFYNRIEWRDWGHTIAYASGTSFTTAAGDGDTTAIYHAGRRVHANGTATGDIYGTIASSSHGAQTTVTVTWDSGSLVSEALTVEVGWAVDTLSSDGIESGTKMLFYQAAAPAGWTIDTGVDDRMIIVDKDNGGTTGGSGSATSITVTIQNESAHTHVVSGSTALGGGTCPNGPSGSACSSANHNHSVSITSQAGSAHTHTADAYTPLYAATIVATKD